MSIGSRIKEARININLTQEELAYKIGVTKGAIANYENEVSVPKTDLLFKLFDALQCDANYLYQDEMKALKNEFVVTLSEQKLIKKYRVLDSYGAELINTIVDKEYTRVMEQSQQVEETPAPYLYTKTEYLTGLSAGTGLFVFDDIPTQVINVPEKYKDADFVIGVSGGSMQPTYYDGDKVAVKKCPCIDKGEIGVFMIDGNGYIKELGDGKLISHNKEYNDIEINDTTVCIGKVLGKLQ